jgi:hypothetical protein
MTQVGIDHSFAHGDGFKLGGAVADRFLLMTTKEAQSTLLGSYQVHHHGRTEDGNLDEEESHNRRFRLTNCKREQHLLARGGKT